MKGQAAMSVQDLEFQKLQGLMSIYAGQKDALMSILGNKQALKMYGKMSGNPWWDKSGDGNLFTGKFW